MQLARSVHRRLLSDPPRKQEIEIKTANELLSVEDAGLPPGSCIRPDPGQRRIHVQDGRAGPVRRDSRCARFDHPFARDQQTPIDRLRVVSLRTYLIDYKEFIGAENHLGDNLVGRYDYLRFNATVDVNLASGA